MSSTVSYITLQTDLVAVERFIEHLSTFNRESWLTVAECPSRAATARDERVVALRALIAHLGLGVEAWNVADDVETAAQYSLGSMQFSLSRRDCDSIRLARQAATIAALALFVRPMLTANDFDVLYQPFERVAPIQDGQVLTVSAPMSPCTGDTSKESSSPAGCVSIGSRDAPHAAPQPSPHECLDSPRAPRVRAARHVGRSGP